MISELTHLHRSVVTQRAARYLDPRLLAARPIPALNRLEFLIFTSIATAFISLQVLIAGPAILYNRTCWIDESITQLLVSDPSASHSVEAIRHGVDTNPPVYHLIGRGLISQLRRFSPVSIRAALRGFSTVCVLAAIVAAYALLRNSFAPWPSAIGLLAVMPHPQLIEQLFEARFYAPSLAAAMALAVSLQWREKGAASGLLRCVAIICCSTLLCTLHYFGVIALGVVVAATLFVETGSGSRRLFRVLPASAGLIALVPFLFYVRTQAAGLTHTTFLVPFSPRAAREFLIEVFYPLPMLVVLAGWISAQLLRQTTPPLPYQRTARLRATVPLLALAAVPLVILVFSAFVQSALRPRYALVAAFATAPVAAMLAATMRPKILYCMAVPLMLMSLMQICGTARMHGEVQKITAAEGVAARADAATVPIVFADRGDAIELTDFAPDLIPRIVLIDDRSNSSEPISERRRYELEMNDKLRPFYPTPQLLRAKELANFQQVRIVGNSDDLSRILLEVPMRRVSENLYAPLH